MLLKQTKSKCLLFPHGAVLVLQLSGKPRSRGSVPQDGVCESCQEQGLLQEKPSEIQKKGERAKLTTMLRNDWLSKIKISTTHLNTE